jgi:hypothetical protein
VSEERLEPEVQIAPSNGDTPPPSEFAEARDDMLESVTGGSRLSPEVQELIEKCMDGTESLGRGLKPWEPEKFNPIHVNMCVLRASGFRGREIAQILDQEETRVSVILRHPYGVKLVKALTVRSSVKVFDIRTKMEEFAEDLLERSYGMAMMEEDLEKVSKVTFGMLDRAGYGPQQSGGEKPKEGFSASENTMRRLARAMEQSQQVKSEVMPGWVPRRPPDEGALPALPAGGVVGAEDGAREENHQQVARAAGQR